MKYTQEDIKRLVLRLQEDPLFYFEHCLKIQEFGSGEPSLSS